MYLGSYRVEAERDKRVQQASSFTAYPDGLALTVLPADAAAAAAADTGMQACQLTGLLPHSQEPRPGLGRQLAVEG